jgi:hypothetical protein
VAFPPAVLVKLVIENGVGTYKASVYYRDTVEPLLAEDSKGEGGKPS